MANKKKSRIRQVWVGEKEHDLVEQLRQRVCEQFAYINKGVFFASVFRYGILGTIERWGGKKVFQGIDLGLLDELSSTTTKGSGL